MFGYSCMLKGGVNWDIINSFMVEAMNIVRERVEELGHRSKLYIYTLKAIAEGRDRWKEIKMTVEAWIMRPLHNPQITRILNNLVKMGIIDRFGERYTISDPIMRSYLRSMAL